MPTHPARALLHLLAPYRQRVIIAAIALGFVLVSSYPPGVLFGLFLCTGIPQAYAKRYLRPEQIDAVDQAAILAKAGLA